jgi:hypothetical protein
MFQHGIGLTEGGITIVGDVESEDGHERYGGGSGDLPPLRKLRHPLGAQQRNAS